MGARIVLVEDSEDVRRYASMLLRRKGYDVDEYPDGKSALEAIETDLPELVVSDVQMPKMTGIELTKHLRMAYDKRELPIVLISVMSEEEDIVRGFEAGANDYLTKPYKNAELLAKVSVLIKERSFLRAPEEEPPPDTSVVPKEMPLEDEEATREVDPLGPAKVRYYFDKYEIVGEYGRGGMGTVYRAVRREDSQPVALKVLAPRLSEDRKSIARFLRETRVLSELQSEHVVQVLDHGYDGGRYFLAMEGVEGDTLDRIVLRSGPLAEDFAVVVFGQVAEALQCIEDAGLVHRDVKPSNIIVNDEQLVKLVDFGLAKREGEASDLSRTGFAMGTPFYIAPEVIEGAEADAASDLFALGVTVFEAMTGRRPFPGVVPYHVFRQIVHGPTPDPWEFRPGLSKEFRALIHRLMERDRRKRYAHAFQVGRDLEQLPT